MLENIREGSQGLTAKIILGLVILTFALAGVGSYTNTADTSAATVNGEKISQQDFERAYQAQRNRMQQQFGEMFDTLAADEAYMANFRNSVLDQLINDELVLQQAKELSLRVSDEQLKTAIRTMPEFQVDGQFDNNRYLALINQAGFYQSSDFRDYLRVEMIKRQLNQSVVASEFALPYMQEMTERLNKQTRDIHYTIINSDSFKATTQVTDEELTAYYDANSSQFSTAEKVKVNYILLDMADVVASIDTSEEELNTYYQENLDSYRSEEQRRAAHILIEFGDDESAAETQINDILASVNADEDFAALAKTKSADTFSGENGGDLDWFGKGVMDPAFEEAAFNLENVGDVTGVVKSEFGFHIIKLLDVKPESIKPFDEVREDLLAKVNNDKAQSQYYELQQTLSELSYESPDSLDEAAEATQLPIKESTWLTRLGNTAPFNNPRVIDVLFSEAVISDNLNSDVIEITPELALVVHLNEYEESKVRPFDDVKSEIQARLSSEKAQQAAQESAEALLVKVNANEDLTEDLATLGTEFVELKGLTRTGATIDANIAQQAFKLAHPVQDAISADVVTLGNGDVAVIRLDAVNKAEIVAEDLDVNSQQQVSELAQSAYRNYIEALKADAEIVRRINSMDTSTL